MFSPAQPRVPRAAALFAAIALLVLGLLGAPAASGRTATTTNPIAGGTWGLSLLPADAVSAPYFSSTGTTRQLLSKIALRSRVRWFTAWAATKDVQWKVEKYIADSQRGDPNVLVPLATFHLYPGREDTLYQPLTAAFQSNYKRWIDNMARGIGKSRVMVIVEPDLPIVLKGWRPAVKLQLVSYAVHAFAALPRTTVYIDGGSSDWLTVDRATSMLLRAGIQAARGFALNGTHYTSTSSNIRHGRQIVALLAQRGVPGKHFVVDTADNGQPFTWAHYYREHPHGFFPNAETCRSKADRTCVTLGIPPTWRVAAPQWHLSTTIAQMALRWCDGYVWYGRPWLTNMSSPFDMKRALAIARTTPYAGP